VIDFERVGFIATIRTASQKILQRALPIRFVEGFLRNRAQDEAYEGILRISDLDSAIAAIWSLVAVIGSSGLEWRGSLFTATISVVSLSLSMIRFDSR
jgi:hypothetical protein